MSAFSTLNERQAALFEQVPVKKGELFSEKLLLTNTRRKKSVSRKQAEPKPKSVEKWKFPKIQLISTGGDQSEQHTLPQSVTLSKRENVIDTDWHLAEAMRVRGLKTKVWKAFLINRMNAIRKGHAKKLSQTYATRRVLFKYLAVWKLYIKRILPEEKANLRADRHHEWTLLARTLRGLREVTVRRRELTAKYVSTRYVLQSQLVKRAFALFRVGVA